MQTDGPNSVTVSLGAESVQLTRRGSDWGMPALKHNSSVTVFGSATQTFEVVDQLDRSSTQVAGDTVIAPMPGLVTAVAVAAGQEVCEGDRLVVLEAMKMEHVLRAPRDGVLAAVSVAEGQQVAAGDLVASLEPEA